MTRLYWQNLLTRDRMFCTLCYRTAQQAFIAETAARLPHPADREPWVRIADPAWFAAGITMVDPKTHAAYTTKLRAAFKAHVAALHPVLPFEIVWHR